MKLKLAPRHRPSLVERDRCKRGIPRPEDRTTDSGPSRIKPRKILVPTDLSASSKKTLAYAVPYAQQFGAAIILLYVVPVQPADVETGLPALAARQKQMAAAQKELGELARREIPGTIKTEMVVSPGEPFVEIVNQAAALDADLIVMTTGRVATLPDFCFGSTAEQVARHARCPVLIVRDAEQDSF